MRIGSIVSYREREWIVLPSEDPEVLVLRPIGGTEREKCGVHLKLVQTLGYTLPFERVKEASFPQPSPLHSSDHSAVKLLLESACLLLRDGAAPFRSMGRLSIRPRPYQLVPLIMALRQETVRLLIADDVGVGKTIEAALIARELLDRGEIQRVGVLCPPYLCSQWEKELREKFHIDSVVISSGTVSKLERDVRTDESIFEYYPHFVASIDLVKSEKYKHAFLQHCPETVIVDEVHGAAEPPGQSKAQQQRHELLKALAQREDRHLILLTATPHSGVESSFLSLLGLVKPSFRLLDLSRLGEEERSHLARRFVQRRRADVKTWMGEDTPFPERENQEVSYQFDPEYRSLFEDVYDFARELVSSAEKLSRWGQRMRYWSALALLRCVGSSPAAAQVALAKRAKSLEEDESFADEDQMDSTFSPLVMDGQEEEAVQDAPPSAVFDAQEKDPHLPEKDKRALREFANRAANLKGDKDKKLLALADVIEDLVSQGFHPIVWCRYIATAEYVAEELRKRLSSKYLGLGVAWVTGVLSDEERRLKVDELAQYSQRVLVATDCLSEGINLQEHFTAVVHYDLPWNPNRLEQREGRVDRFGQKAPKVKAVLMVGTDNPVDGAVLEVLLKKAREIHKSLRIYVPVPVDSEKVMEAVFNSIFRRRKTAIPQLSLFEDYEAETKGMIERIHKRWDWAASAEKESRSRFAQRAIKPEEVERELHETDDVLGNPQAVQRFLEEASQRLGFSLEPKSQDIWELSVSRLPEPVRYRLGEVPDPWLISFTSPTPEGATYIGRNHELVEALSEHLLDLALHHPEHNQVVSRCGVIRTDYVSRRTTLFLLRSRYLTKDRKKEGSTILMEETLVWGFEGLFPQIDPLDPQGAKELLDELQATTNVSPQEKQEVLEETLDWWQDLQPRLEPFIKERCQQLEASHRRVRRLTKEGAIKLEPSMPPDLLGVLVAIPVPNGVA
jgi:superfamily II DNA or RNA helicase